MSNVTDPPSQQASAEETLPPRFPYPDVQAAYLRLKAGDPADCLQRVLPYLSGGLERPGQAAALLVAGVASAQLGHLETASTLLQTAESLGFVERDLSTVGTAARELARLLVGWGRGQEARRRLEQAIELHKLAESHTELAQDLMALGQLRQLQGYAEGAQEAVKEAVAVGMALSGEAFHVQPEASSDEEPLLDLSALNLEGEPGGAEDDGVA